MRRMGIKYLINRKLSNSKIVQTAVVGINLLLEFFFSRQSVQVYHSIVEFNKPLIPLLKLKITVSQACNKYSYNGLCFNIVDFSKKTISSWFVSQPKVSKTNQLFRKYVTNYNSSYLRLRVPFMGLGRPHLCQCSVKGYICAPNGFYNYIVNTISDEICIYPENYLLSEPMHYAKQGAFSSDGMYWYTVRWPLVHWADVIDKKRNGVECEVCKINLMNKKEEILLKLDYQDEIHEISCSPDDKYLVFCTFKQDMYLGYPNKSFYKAPEEYKASHQRGGVKPQSLVTVDLISGRYWMTNIPFPTIGHTVFDPVNQDVVFLSAHNLVFHELTTFSEGTATLVKLKISDGKTEIINTYTDDKLLRIFQHQVFLYKGTTLLAVMSYPNTLYILEADRFSLIKKITIGPEIAIDFSLTGNYPLEERKDIFFTVNVSEDGRFIVLGNAGGYAAYDMEEDTILDFESILPKGFGYGTGHTRTHGN